MSQIQVSADATNITLAWPEPFDGFSTILHYVVSLREGNSSNFTFQEEVNATSMYNSASIMGLLPYRTYFARIIPFNRIGAAENANEIMITTMVSGTSLLLMCVQANYIIIVLSAPSAPQNLTVNATSSTSLFASWAEPETPNGPIDIYKVYLQKVNDVGHGVKRKRSSSQLQPVKRVSMTSASVTNLEKFTSYRVFVKAANRDGNKELEGPSSNIVMIITYQDGKAICEATPLFVCIFWTDVV